jgi:hypothetical protein
LRGSRRFSTVVALTRRSASRVGALTLALLLLAFASSALGGKLPPSVRCDHGPECEVRTLIKYSGTPPPGDGSSEYPVTIKGRIESTGLDGLCQPHRKIIVDLIWVVGEGTLDSIRRTVRTDSSNHFSYTFIFKVPPPHPILKGRSYTVAAYANFERRKSHGESVICTESVPPRNGTKWAATNNTYPYE